MPFSLPPIHAKVCPGKTWSSCTGQTREEREREGAGEQAVVQRGMYLARSVSVQNRRILGEPQVRAHTNGETAVGERRRPACGGTASAAQIEAIPQ